MDKDTATLQHPDATLQEVMDGFFGGSEGRTRHMFNKRFVHTEGMDAVAEHAGAYWLIDKIALEVAPIFRRAWKAGQAGLGIVTMNVKRDGTADIELTLEDDAPKPWKTHLSFTTFPPGEWNFYLAQDAVLGDPDNDGVGYTVLYLPQEH